MGSCGSKQKQMISDIIDLEGGDDNYQAAEKRGGGGCCCCGGPAEEQPLFMEEDEGDIEHKEGAPGLEGMDDEQRGQIKTIAERTGAIGVGAGDSAADERVPVDLSADPLRSSLARTCFILMGDGYSWARGSGIILDWIIDGKPVKFVMTCAHCLADSDVAASGRIKFYNDISCYTLYNGQFSYAQKYKVLRAYVHPAWRGSPSYGFDYGIGILGAEELGDIPVPATYDDYFVSQVSRQTESVMKGAQGYVVGYPAAWDKTMTEMEGPFRFVQNKTVGQYEGRAVFYDIDQTGGNSGGPVFTKDPNFIAALKNETTMNLDDDDNMCLMGIVTGAGYEENVGTILTPQIFQWTFEKLKQGKDVAGNSVDSQPGRTGNSGGATWQPRKPSQNNGNWSMADFATFQITSSGSGNVSVIGITHDGRQVRLSRDQFSEMTGGAYDHMLG